MKKSRYAASQILAKLKQNESGLFVPDLCREHGMNGNILRGEVCMNIYAIGNREGG